MPALVSFKPERRPRKAYVHLTEAMVRDILASKEFDKACAMRLGISTMQVHNIRNGRVDKWRYLTGPETWPQGTRKATRGKANQQREEARQQR